MLFRSQKRPDTETREQLAALGYLENGRGARGRRPLLICDVDEVVLHLVTPFADLLTERGFMLKSHSFRLTGNVFHAESGREATQEEVWATLQQLFDQQAVRQGLVDGASAALNALSEDIDVLFLTNMPHEFRDTRAAHLIENGLDHPLVTNTGSKMPAIDVVKRHRDAPMGFIDDTPRNLEHVREGAPDVHLFHFMANGDFRALADQVDGTHFSTGDWSEAADGIRRVLLAPPAGR